VAGWSLNCASYRAVGVNVLAQEALRRFTHWPWIEHPTFQLGGGHCDTELIACHNVLHCLFIPVHGEQTLVLVSVWCQQLEVRAKGLLGSTLLVYFGEKNLRFFRCPGVFAIAMVSFSSLKFLTFAKINSTQVLLWMTRLFSFVIFKVPANATRECAHPGVWLPGNYSQCHYTDEGARTVEVHTSFILILLKFV